jgi:hypothetical protein
MLRRPISESLQTIWTLPIYHTIRSLLGARCEGQGRKDSRWPPAAGRRVHRDAGTASAADGQAGARELSGFFRPSGWSGPQAPPALEINRRSD